jgi:hypothetical protein
MPQRVLATMVTTTSYGTWLPGDIRGYVANGQILPHDPQVLARSKQLMSNSPVFFSAEQQDILFDALCRACDEFHYRLLHASVESWHLHWNVDHGFDPVATVVGRLKNRMRQALNVGRIWTDGYYDRYLFTHAEIENCADYIRRHRGWRRVEV